MEEKEGGREIERDERSVGSSDRKIAMRKAKAFARITRLEGWPRGWWNTRTFSSLSPILRLCFSPSGTHTISQQTEVSFLLSSGLFSLAALLSVRISNNTQATLAPLFAAPRARTRAQI